MNNNLQTVALQSSDFGAESDRILTQIADFQQQGKSLFVTSSFQTQSLPLLHILSQAERKIPVAFIDTGYLFPETYRFRDQLTEQFGLDVRILRSNVPISNQLAADRRFLFSQSPGSCCQINKVDVLGAFSESFDVWISGVRGDQSSVRKQLKPIQTNDKGTIRFHPMLQWNAKMVYLYRKQFDLPEHPLEQQGYLSIGCMPCTARYLDDMGEQRSGRWSGMNKQECGLHTDLA